MHERHCAAPAADMADQESGGQVGGYVDPNKGAASRGANRDDDIPVSDTDEGGTDEGAVNDDYLLDGGFETEKGFVFLDGQELMNASSNPTALADLVKKIESSPDAKDVFREVSVLKSYLEELRKGTDYGRVVKQMNELLETQSVQLDDAEKDYVVDNKRTLDSLAEKSQQKLIELRATQQGIKTNQKAIEEESARMGALDASVRTASREVEAAKNDLRAKEEVHETAVAQLKASTDKHVSLKSAREALRVMLAQTQGEVDKHNRAIETATQLAAARYATTRASFGVIDEAIKALKALDDNAVARVEEGMQKFEVSQAIHDQMKQNILHSLREDNKGAADAIVRGAFREVAELFDNRRRDALTSNAKRQKISKPGPARGPPKAAKPPGPREAPKAGEPMAPAVNPMARAPSKVAPTPTPAALAAAKRAAKPGEAPNVAQPTPTKKRAATPAPKKEITRGELKSMLEKVINPQRERISGDAIYQDLWDWCNPARGEIGEQCADSGAKTLEMLSRQMTYFFNRASAGTRENALVQDSKLPLQVQYLIRVDDDATNESKAANPKAAQKASSIPRTRRTTDIETVEVFEPAQLITRGEFFNNYPQDEPAEGKHGVGRLLYMSVASANTRQGVVRDKDTDGQSGSRVGCVYLKLPINRHAWDTQRARLDRDLNVGDGKWTKWSQKKDEAPRHTEQWHLKPEKEGCDEVAWNKQDTWTIANMNGSADHGLLLKARKWVAMSMLSRVVEVAKTIDEAGIRYPGTWPISKGGEGDKFIKRKYIEQKDADKQADAQKREDKKNKAAASSGTAKRAPTSAPNPTDPAKKRVKKTPVAASAPQEELEAFMSERFVPFDQQSKLNGILEEAYKGHPHKKNILEAYFTEHGATQPAHIAEYFAGMTRLLRTTRDAVKKTGQWPGTLAHAILTQKQCQTFFQLSSGLDTPLHGRFSGFLLHHLGMRPRSLPKGTTGTKSTKSTKARNALFELTKANNDAAELVRKGCDDALLCFAPAEVVERAAKDYLTTTTGKTTSPFGMLEEIVEIVLRARTQYNKLALVGHEFPADGPQKALEFLTALSNLFKKGNLLQCRAHKTIDRQSAGLFWCTQWAIARDPGSYMSPAPDPGTYSDQYGEPFNSSSTNERVSVVDLLLDHDAKAADPLVYKPACRDAEGEVTGSSANNFANKYDMWGQWWLDTVAQGDKTVTAYVKKEKIAGCRFKPSTDDIFTLSPEQLDSEDSDDGYD